MAAPTSPAPPSPTPALACLRCQGPLEDLGWRSFESWRVGKLFTGNIALLLRKCGACGHVEFFAESDSERQAREEAETREAQARRLRGRF